jgi:hypothetical protein
VSDLQFALVEALAEVADLFAPYAPDDCAPGADQLQVAHHMCVAWIVRDLLEQVATGGLPGSVPGA